MSLCLRQAYLISSCLHDASLEFVCVEAELQQECDALLVVFIALQLAVSVNLTKTIRFLWILISKDVSLYFEFQKPISSNLTDTINIVYSLVTEQHD